VPPETTRLDYGAAAIAQPSCARCALATCTYYLVTDGLNDAWSFLAPPRRTYLCGFCFSLALRPIAHVKQVIGNSSKRHAPSRDISLEISVAGRRRGFRGTLALMCPSISGRLLRGVAAAPDAGESKRREGARTPKVSPFRPSPSRTGRRSTLVCTLPRRECLREGPAASHQSPCRSCANRRQRAASARLPPRPIASQGP
jgi:hypothetical protein